MRLDSKHRGMTRAGLLLAVLVASCGPAGGASSVTSDPGQADPADPDPTDPDPTDPDPTDPDPTDPDPTDPDPAEPDPSLPCPGARDPGPSGLALRDLIQYGYAGDTDLAVAFCNPLMLEPSEELVFFVSITNHFGIPASDPATGTWVEASGELRAAGDFAWVGDDLLVEEHHADGLLRGPRTTDGGLDLLGPDTTYLLLHVQGIGSGSDEVVLEWRDGQLR